MHDFDFILGKEIINAVHKIIEKKKNQNFLKEKYSEIH
jgi:hypothetical protein